MTHTELIDAAKAAIRAVGNDRNVSTQFRIDSIDVLAGEIEAQQEALAEEYAVRDLPRQPEHEDRYGQDFA